MNALNLDTVLLAEDRSCLNILDQTLLPGRTEVLALSRLEDIWEAIKSLRVRGAPAIGVCAAYAYALAASQLYAGIDCSIKDDNGSTTPEENRDCASRISEKKAVENKISEYVDSEYKNTEKMSSENEYSEDNRSGGSGICNIQGKERFFEELRKRKAYLASARPTAVNLSWALNRMEQKAIANADKEISYIVELLFAEADAIRSEDIAISRGIGEIGFGLLHKGDGILTHCNAGTLATAKYGTATAPMYIALEHGFSGSELHVYCDETRPLLQGARLTAFEMQGAGIDTTLICDNMASSVMKEGRINIIFVGCDRVARNGDAANKIGTSGVAVLAKYYGIPFYVCAPSSTIDMSIASGNEIPIEQRAPEEVTEMWYRERMAPAGIKVCNPAFDVTDHSLITGIITERGLCTAPYEEAFRKLGIG